MGRVTGIGSWPGPSHLSASPGLLSVPGLQAGPGCLGMGGSSFPFCHPAAAASLLSKGSGDSGDNGDSGSWWQVLASRPMSDCGVGEASFQLRWSSGVVCSCRRGSSFYPHAPVSPGTAVDGTHEHRGRTSATSAPRSVWCPSPALGEAALRGSSAPMDAPHTCQRLSTLHPPSLA